MYFVAQPNNPLFTADGCDRTSPGFYVTSVVVEEEPVVDEDNLNIKYNYEVYIPTDVLCIKTK